MTAPSISPTRAWASNVIGRVLEWSALIGQLHARSLTDVGQFYSLYRLVHQLQSFFVRTLHDLSLPPADK